MRLVDRHGLMEMPAGTVYATLYTVFHGLFMKGDTLVTDGRNVDWFDRSLSDVDGPAGTDHYDLFDRMAAEGLSYPLNTGYGRDGMYDDDARYLIYEPDDLRSLVAAFTPGASSPQD